jgi:hypothetical protein
LRPHAADSQAGCGRKPGRKGTDCAQRRASYTSGAPTPFEGASVLTAKSPRSITNMVFIVILAALILGIADLAWNMIQSATSGPG